MGGGSSTPEQQTDITNPTGEGSDGVDDSVHIQLSVIRVVGGGTLALVMLIGFGGAVTICWAKAKFLGHHVRLEKTEEKLTPAELNDMIEKGRRQAESLGLPAAMPSRFSGLPKMTFADDSADVHAQHQYLAAPMGMANMTPTGFQWSRENGLRGLNPQAMPRTQAPTLLDLGQLLKLSGQSAGKPRIREVKKKKQPSATELLAQDVNASGADALVESQQDGSNLDTSEDEGADQLLRENLRRQLALCDSSLNKKKANQQ